MDYNIASPISIEKYSKTLVGKTFRDILPEDFKEYGGKGNLGQLLEKYFFMYEPNSDKEPDFPEASVELKVTGYKALKTKGQYSAKERLSLSIIDYMEIVNETFEDSSFLHKNALLLLIFYLYEAEQESNLDFRIDYAQLFEYPSVDFKIIKDDWLKIVSKVKAGKAHELSEGDTNYLGAATKGSGAGNDRTQPFSTIMARQRAFSLKNKYLTYILREYILQEKSTYDSIIKNTLELENTTFEQLIITRLSEHFGKSEIQLLEELEITKQAKNYASRLANGLLGVKTENSTEFEKANISVKTIRLEQNNTIEQHMSFPHFSFKELVTEDWDDSTWRTLLSETKFLFVIFKKDASNTLVLKDAFFWNMPYNLLESEIKKVWLDTVNTLRDGVELTPEQQKNRIIIRNNLPSPSQSYYSHVRPHTSLSSYEPFNSNADELPDGRWMTKQCFWLNRELIETIISLNCNWYSEPRRRNTRDARRFDYLNR